MSRLPFWFILTGIVGFVLFHVASLASLTSWLGGQLRGPEGWFHIHLFVLGWAAMLAMGAVYQLIHVILQSSIYSEWLGYVHYVSFTAGLAGLLIAFKLGNVFGIGTFAALTFIGIALFAWNMAVTLFRAGKWNAITISTACAVLYLLLAGLTGMAMGLNFVFGLWNELHLALFGAHIWLGTVGWFGLLITGFSYKMLPMFYLAHQYPTRLQHLVLILWNAAVLSGAIVFLTGTQEIWMALPLTLLAAAILLYNGHLLQIRKFRHKRSPGPGIRWSMYGNQAFAVLAVAALILVLWSPEQALGASGIRLAGWVYLGGWVSFTILAYASKIVPFLWWTHKYGRHAGKPGTPVMADLLKENKVNAALAAVAATSLCMIAALLLHEETLLLWSGTLYSLASTAYIVLIGTVFAK